MNSAVKINTLLAILGFTLAMVSAKGCPAITQCLECPVIDGQYKCTKCQTPLYAYDEETNKCIGCKTMKGCHLCNNLTRCDRCENFQMGPDPYGGTCSKCAANCKSCRIIGSGKCDTCDEGFCRTKDGTCDQCIRNCRFCSDSTTCNECDRGYYRRSATECAICILNCDVCSDSSTCIRCFPGYYMKGNNKSCISCGNNCRSCSSDGKCTSCKNGKVSAEGTCECAPNCSSCNNSGFGKCDTCEHGYKKTVDKTCIKAEDS